MKTRDARAGLLLDLEGGQNFRDLGGYETDDGRTVKWGVIYRSGSMHGMTRRDHDAVMGLNIRAVCDFRSTAERQQEPVNWPAGHTPTIFADDYLMDFGPLKRVFSDSNVSVEEARQAFAAFYGELPYRFNGQYRRMFEGLLAHHVPMVFNCSAGKDRTGVCAALLLTALGVSREKVMRDYLLSNETFDLQKSLATDPDVDADWRRLPPELLEVLVGAHDSCLDAVFDSIKKRSGSLGAYFGQEMQLTDSCLQQLRRSYLE